MVSRIETKVGIRDKIRYFSKGRRSLRALRYGTNGRVPVSPTAGFRII